MEGCAAVEVPPTNPTKKRVLLAEDDLRLRVALTRVLGGAGYDVVVVSDGAEALGMLQAGSAFDLVVTDSRMPLVSGPELVRALRGAGSTIPVVLLSGAPPEPGQIREWQRLGGVTWMQKPFDVRGLLVVLARALGEGTSG